MEIQVQIKGQPGHNPHVEEEDSEESNKDGDEDQEEPQQIRQYNIDISRARRNRRVPVRYFYEEDLVAIALVIGAGDPSTYQDALSDKDKSKWMLAMQEDMESLYKN